MFVNVVDRIFQLKEERNLTSKDVEVGAGLANSSLSQWKKGKGKPSLENIIKVASYFNVSTDYLLCLSDEKNSRGETDKSLSEEEKLLLRAYNNATVHDKFRIIQICMNSLDENIRKYGDLFLNY